jgi:Transglutaminase-like superfamily
MWEPLRRFNALDRRAKLLFVRAWIALFWISLSLRWRGFRATNATLRPQLAPSSKKIDGSVTATTVRLVRAAARHSFVRPTCLQESLTLWWLLARQGIPAELRVGVRKDGPKFAAHAWVESEGVALNEPNSQHQHYAAFKTELAASHAVMR